MKFRPHCGTLADSMAQMVELDGRMALITHVMMIAPCIAFSSNLATPEELIEVKPYVDQPDDRIGWKKTNIVVIKDWGPVGYCDDD